MKYSIDFLKEDWDGSGLDLEVALRGQVIGGNIVELVRAAIPKGWEVRHWNAVAVNDSNLVGHSWAELDEVLGAHLPLFLSIYFVSGQYVPDYIVVAAPDEVEVGAASDWFFSGSEPVDLKKIAVIVELLRALEPSFSSLSGAFAFAGEARRQAELLFDQHVFGYVGYASEQITSRLKELLVAAGAR